MSGLGTFSLASAHSQHWSSTWSGTSSDTLIIRGNLSLWDHAVHNVHLAHEDGRYMAQDSRFSGGSSSSSGRLNLSACQFLRHPLTHQSNVSGPPHLIQNCTFDMGPLGVSSRSSATLRLEECQFQRLGVGVSVQGMRCEMACCEFRDNDVAAEANRSLLALTPSEGGGRCRFEDNDVHLRFVQATIPLWTLGGNHFGNWGSQWAQGSFNLNCTGPISIEATGQSWSWPPSWPQIQTGLWASSPAGSACPVTVVDLNPVPEQDCTWGKGKRKE